MNIFVLDLNPFVAAQQHCDKHVVKMILEYGQMLSTAHRLKDGRHTEWVVTNPETGRRKRIVECLLPDESAEPVWREPQHVDDPERYMPGRFELVIENQQCYRTAHANHPCSVWARETDANYHWLAMLFQGTLQEYTLRYGKQHSAARLAPFFQRSPHNIKPGVMTPFAQAMPDEYKHEDAVEAYHRFYAGAKARFARWTEPAAVPTWFIRKTGTTNAALFTRAARLDRRSAVHAG